MTNCIVPTPPSGESLNLGVTIFNPISSVPGSASLFYLQPILSGKIFYSVGIIIGVELFLFIAQRFFGLEGVPTMDSITGNTVQMPVKDLQEFLLSLSDNNPNNAAASGITTGVPSGVQSSFITGQTSEAPMVIGLAIYGDYSTQAFSPTLFLLIPVLTLPGLRGAIPMLILEVLATIFVRAVVPPQTTGSRPLTANNKGPIQFTPDELLKFLNRFSKYFNTK